MARRRKTDGSGSRHRMLCLASVVAGVVLALTSAPTLATTRSVPALDRGWTPSSIPVLSPGTRIGVAKVVVGGPGLLALGGTSSSAHPVALWSSADGRSWRSVPLGNDVFPENATVSDMVAGPHGIVIAGEIQSGGPLVGAPRAWVFWWSPDGRHWSRSATPTLPDGPILVVESVAAGPTGFAAIVQVIPPPSSGQTVPPFPRVVLTSPDGRTWQQAASPLSTFVPNYQDGIAEGGPAYVLVGTNQAQGVSYTSRDGRTWSGPFLLPGSALGCCALFTAHGLLIAVESGATGQRIWTSTDGQRWQASTWQAGSESFIWTIASVGNLLVAMGRSSAGSSVLWASTDGHHWTQAADDRAFERSPAQRAELRSMVGFRGGLEAVGSIGPAPTAIGGSFGYGLCNPPPTATALSPTAWRWTPRQSAAALPSRPSPLDPRTFSLRPSDMPGADGPFQQGGYASICSSPFSQALGRYTAYQSGFLFRAWSLTIVAESDKAAHAALLRAPTFFTPAYYPGGAKEQRVTKRIGTETRLFATQALIPNGDDAPMRVPARAVIWRRSRQMGIVVVYSSKDRGPQGLVVDALRFAAAQDAHLRQALAR